MHKQPLSGFRRTAKALEFDAVRQRIAAHCATGRGAELCLGMEPVEDRPSAERLLDETGEMHPLAKSGWRLFPSAIPDPGPVLERIRKGSLPEPEEIKILAGFLDGAGRIRDFLSDNPDKPALATLCAGFEAPEELSGHFDATFDGAGMIKPDASALLMELEGRIAALRRNIHAQAEELLARNTLATLFQDVYVTVRNERLVLPVKAEYKNSFPGIVHGISASDKTVFMEPQELVSGNNALQEARAERDAEAHRILRETAEMIREAAGLISTGYAVMGVMDAVFARALFSAQTGGARPGFGEGTVSLLTLRHPVMVAEGEDPRPNDLELKSHEKAVIVSGPNAGGKTVILKSAGLAAVMASCGVFPAVGENTLFPFVSRVFAIAGDEQSIAEGESTFTAQLRGLREALEGAHEGDWVIIDEILNGTDPSQAGALAEAMLDAFAARGCRLFVSTHLPSLKITAREKPYMVNAAMGFGADGKPTFRLEKGLPGVSRPLDIAASAGIPPEIIEAARAKLTSSQDQYQDALADLQKKTEELQSRIRGLQMDERRVSAQIESLGRDGDALRLAKEEFHQEKRRRLKEEVARAREVIAAMLADVRDKDEKAKREAAAKLKAKENELVADIRKADSVPLETLKKGDPVWVVPLDKEAIVEDFLDDGRLAVLCGGLRMTLGRSDLLGMKQRTAPQQTPRRPMAQSGEEENPEINLMGLTFDEAAPALDKFLDARLLSGTERVKIIHGRGTLRAKIGNYLKESPYIKTFGSGASAEGGDAVTMAELKD